MYEGVHSQFTQLIFIQYKSHLLPPAILISREEGGIFQKMCMFIHVLDVYTPRNQTDRAYSSESNIHGMSFSRILCVCFIFKKECLSQLYFPYLLSFLCIGGETGPCMCLVIFFSFVNFYPIEKLIHTPCSNLNNFYFYSLHLNLFKCVITPHHNF